MSWALGAWADGAWAGTVWAIPSAEPAQVVGGIKKRRFHVHMKDNIFVFDTMAEAQLFTQQQQTPEQPKKKRKKQQFKLVKPIETISLPSVVESAPDWAQQRLQHLIEQARYSQLMELIREIEEEDELELILLAL